MAIPEFGGMLKSCELHMWCPLWTGLGGFLCCVVICFGCVGVAVPFPFVLCYCAIGSSTATFEPGFVGGFGFGGQKSRDKGERGEKAEQR